MLVKECLLLQLESKPASDTINLAKAILTKQYTAFTNKNYEKLIKEFEVDDNQLKEAYKEVEQLNPKPGASFTNTQEGNTLLNPLRRRPLGLTSEQFLIVDITVFR